MKRKLLITLLCAAVLCCLCGAALGESKTEYYQRIDANLDNLENALAVKDRTGADSALSQVRNSVYAGMRYLARIGEYDSRAMEIISNANKAQTMVFSGIGDYASYMSQARELNALIFGYEESDIGSNEFHEHRCSEYVVTVPATCVSKGLASGCCDAGVTVRTENGSPVEEWSNPCNQNVTFELEIDPNNHAGGTEIEGPNIVCSACGEVLSSYHVIIDTDIANGTVALSGERSQFAENETIALTVAPAQGYELASLTYTPANGSAVNIADDASGNYSFPMPAANVTVSATFRQIVYTVTLDPGDGAGGSITYTSANGISTESRQTVGNCQFYYEDDGSLAFRLEENYYPDTFAAPADHAFDGWQGNGGYNKLSAVQTTFTARWKRLPAGYSLSPTAYTLTGGGYTDIECTLTSLVLGQTGDEQATHIGFFMNGGTLSDGNGNSIPFLVDDPSHTEPGSRKDQGNSYSAQGETFIMAVYIDPEAYNQAVPGTYTGTFTYDGIWNDGIAGESGSIALTLVRPEQTYAVTTDDYSYAFVLDWLTVVAVTEAQAGDELTLAIDDTVLTPADQNVYCTGEYLLDGTSLGARTEDGVTTFVGTFTMPAHPVRIDAVLAPRTPASVRLSGSLAAPLDDDLSGWLTMVLSEDESTLMTDDGRWLLDLNGDGTADVSIGLSDEDGFDAFRVSELTGEYVYAIRHPRVPVGPVTFALAELAFGTPDFTLPAFLTTVEEDAFEGIAASVVDVPAYCVSIGDHAFRGCPNLTQIRIPACCELGADVFDGCTMVYIFGSRDSDAEAYCQSHDNCMFVPVE